MGKLGQAFTSLFLDKKARQKLEQDKKKKKKRARKAAKSEREQHLENIQQQAGEVVTEDRQELIRNAMQVRQAKAKILEDLDDETRQQLVAVAMKQLLNQDPEDQGGNNSGNNDGGSGR